MKHFKKLIEKNPNIDFSINTIINEYDIKSAYTTACYFIFGKEKYDELMTMEKLERNTTIGKMIQKDHSLYEKISTLLLQWMNGFCEANGIQEMNFISSTRDSILLTNKKPIKTHFGPNGIIHFRNKDGEFTSYIRIRNLEILFDRMSYNLRIKGINKETVDENLVFIPFFKEALSTLEGGRNLRLKRGIKAFGRLRDKYIKSQNIELYRSLLDNNKFLYIHQPSGDLIKSDIMLPQSDEYILLKHKNYVDFIMPLYEIFFKIV